MTSSAASQISELVALIVSSAEAIELHFKSSSEPCVPSLDDITPHPLDTESPSAIIQQAVQTIEGACAQLCTTLARPSRTVLNKFMGVYEPACLNVIVNLKIPDILQEKPSGMHIAELGQKTGLEMGKLGRVLRLLATKHCFREVETDVFANNRLSLELLSTNPLSSFALYHTDETSKSLAFLTDALTDPVSGKSYAPEHTAFNKWSKYPRPLWDYFENTPEGRERGARLGVGMTGYNVATDSNRVVKDFPWGELRHGASVCDVGGGVGHIAMELAKTYPDLRLKLQDTPERIYQAETEIWPSQCPRAIQENRIEFKAIDFLFESPIKDCDVYYVKDIIRNWPDAQAIQILRRVRDAMSPTSRLIIHGHIMQHVNRIPVELSQIRQAPEPLLPNYGVGKILQYNVDLNMLAMLNSQERDLEGHNRLATAAGLRFVRIWDFGDSFAVEYCLE